MQTGINLLVICSCAVTACAREEVRRDFQKTVALPTGRSVRVVNSLGSVSVHTQAKGELAVRAEMRCSADRAEEARDYCNRVQIHVEESGTGTVVRTEYPRMPMLMGRHTFSVSIRLDLTMPESAPLELRNQFGPVTVQDLRAPGVISNSNGRVSFLNGRGRQRIDNSFGDVEVGSNDGPVTIVNTNGAVTVTDVAGTLDLSNRFGDTRVRNAGAGVTVRNANGKVEVEHVTGITQVSDSFGDVRVNGAQSGVTVQNQNGRVEATDVTGAADLSTSFGAIKFSRIGKDVVTHGQNTSINGDTVSGSVTAETSFGAVDVRGVKGQARVTAGNAAVRLSDIGGEVYAKTSFDGVAVESAGGPVTVESANGSITVTLRPGPCKPVSLRTSFGPIRVTLPGAGPGAAGYNLSAKTSFGRIQSEPEITVIGNISTDQITGKIGPGGCELRLVNQNGNIDILKGR